MPTSFGIGLTSPPKLPGHSQQGIPYEPYCSEEICPQARLDFIEAISSHT